MAHNYMSLNEIRSREILRVNSDSIYIFSDSYLSPERRYYEDWNEYMAQVSTMNMAPHTILDHTGTNRSIGRVRICQKGGLKLADVARGPRCISERNYWADNVPSVTVFCVGACDLNNTYLSGGPVNDLRRQYAYYVQEKIMEFVNSARNHAMSPELFNMNLRNHRFIICEPANWGVNYVPRGNIDPDRYRQSCTRAQNSLQRAAKRLWESYSTSLFSSSPSFQSDRNWDRNHLAVATQHRYVGELLKAISNIMCQHCTPDTEFVRQEHNRHHLPNSHCNH